MGVIRAVLIIDVCNVFIVKRNKAGGYPSL